MPLATQAELRELMAERAGLERERQRLLEVLHSPGTVDDLAVAMQKFTARLRAFARRLQRVLPPAENE